MHRWVVIAAGVVGFLSGLARGQEGLKNPGFEDADAGGKPVGWEVSTPSYSAKLNQDAPAEGRSCLRLEKAAEGGEGGFGVVYQTIPAAHYRGKRVVLTGSLRARGGASAQMWMRVDDTDGTSSALDNMGDRQVRGAAWSPARIVLDVGPKASAIFVGLIMAGPQGSVDMDGLELRSAGEIGAGNEPPRALAAQGLANLRALARVYGVVRYFHSSDQARKADWDFIAIEGVRRVEGAGSPEELARKLGEVFGAIAPSAAFAAGKAPEASSAPAGATKAVAMRYEGLGTEEHNPQAVYSATREEWPLGGAAPEGMPEPGAAFSEEVAPGVWARIPIVVYAGDSGSLPGPAAGPLKAEGRPEGWEPSGADRATRLAAVIVAWNAMEHFSPYLDSPGVDWAAELPRALSSAAEAADAGAFYKTVCLLAAGLRDGHTNVQPMPAITGAFPWQWAWAGGKAAVGRVVEGRKQPAPGDVVVSIDGRPMDEIVAARGALISAATEQWRRARLTMELHREAHEHAHVEFKRPDGSLYSVEVNPVPMAQAVALKDRRPETGSELAPGIIYFNLDGASNAAVTQNMDRLLHARAIVFDMRGYPGQGFRMLLPQMWEQTLTSANWQIPVITRPDRAGAEYGSSHWTLPPIGPRLTAPKVFITDGRAISYAESCMGIVEHYKLGRIVGGPTAGTNGNINFVRLPGGLTMSFTGMRVTKQDGSRHHGVGIQPTDPVEPTAQGLAAGRDELLDRATEIAKEIAGP